ncbi:MAG TPA: non-homologous end-joining DNA ligase [Bacillota bacterium]
MSASLWQPGRLKPMLAERAREPFDSTEHLYEIKWDGYRCLAFIDGRGGVFLQSRNGRDLTPLAPEVAGELARMPVRAILDGELVAWRNGRPDFGALQGRWSLPAGRYGRPPGGQPPITLIAFDLLHWAGEDLDRVACVERRRRLAALFESPLGDGGGAVLLSPELAGGGKELFARAIERGLEGLVAKRRASPYRPGRRSRDWLKLVRERVISCVIGGVTAGAQFGIGALLVGVYADANATALTYLGHVGTGFDRERIVELAARLRASRTCPFLAVPRSYATAQWVEPEVVCDVAYLELTREGRLRHPVYRGLRPDVEPRQCRLPGDDAPVAGGERAGVDHGNLRSLW